MTRPKTALALALALTGAACARTKSEPSPAPSASSSTTPASASAPVSEGGAARIKLCSDGFHKPGDHWKEACNPCRCAADGQITCAHFPCIAAGDAGDAGDAGARAEAGARGDAAP